MTLYMPLFRSSTTLRLLTQLHAHIFVSGLHNDPSPSTKLIESYAQMGAINSSRRVFETFPNPDSFMSGVLIKCYVWNNLFGEAISLYAQIMRKNAHKTSNFVFPSVLRACSGISDLGISKEVHGRIIKCGFDEDIVIQTSLLSFYGENGCLDHARKVFDEMPVRDVVSWSCIISSYIDNGDVNQGLEMFRSMVVHGIRPDSVSLLSVAEACAEVGSLSLARSIHCLMVKVKIECDGSLANSMIAMYSKCGDLCSSRRIFLSLSDPCTSSWTAMISCFNRSGCFQEAVETFRDMLKVNVKPNCVTITAVVGSCAGMCLLREGKSVHCHVIKKDLVNNDNPDHDDFLGPALIEFYAKCGVLSYCDNVLLMHAAQGQRNIVSWNALVSIYAQSGYSMKALLLFQRMQRKGQIIPDSFSLSIALSACADVGLLQLGYQIHGHLIKRGRGVSDDEYVKNSLIDMYSKCGCIELAHTVFDEIKQSSVSISVVSWNSIICGFSQNGYSSEAISIFDQMYRDCLEVNEVTLVSVLQACSNSGYLEKGKWVHHKIVTSGVKDNSYVNTALADMYAKCGDLKTAQKLFDHMAERTVVSWSAMIAGYGAHGLINSAISLFNRMVESGIRPNEVTFMNILSACSHAGAVKEGKFYFHTMRDFGIEPNTEHYACLVDLLSRAGDLSEAYEIIKAMPVPANASIWAALLNGCRIHQRTDIMNVIEGEISRITSDDTGFYTLLSNIYAQEGKWIEFGNVRSLMRGIGLRKVPAFSVIQVDKKAFRFGAGDTSLLRNNKILSFLENFQILAAEEQQVYV